MTGPLTAGHADFYTLELTGEVLLSGSLVAGGTGDFDFYLRDASGVVFQVVTTGDEACTESAIAG